MKMNILIRLTTNIRDLIIWLKWIYYFAGLAPEILMTTWMTRKHLPFQVAFVCYQTCTSLATSIAVASCPLKTLAIPQYLSIDTPTHTYTCAHTHFSHSSHAWQCCGIAFQWHFSATWRLRFLPCQRAAQVSICSDPLCRGSVRRKRLRALWEESKQGPCHKKTTRSLVCSTSQQDGRVMLRWIAVYLKGLHFTWNIASAFLKLWAATQSNNTLQHTAIHCQCFPGTLFLGH